MISKSIKKFPEIVIRYNRLLDPIFIVYVRNDPEWEEKHSPDKWSPWRKEDLLKNVEECRKEWKKYEKQILEGITKVLCLNFYRKVIDVHIVSTNPRSFSSPIVIRGTFPPLEFVESLTHELIHELFTYGKHCKLYFKILKEMFPGDKSNLIINHVLVYAVLEYLFKDVLKNIELQRIGRDKAKRANNYKDYKYALDLVNEKGYMNIIQEFRNRFDKCKKNELYIK